MRPNITERAPHLDLEAASPEPKEAGSRGNADGLFASLASAAATSESAVRGGVSEGRWVSGGPSSCHGTLSLERKAAVEEAVLLCVAVKEVASMPLSAELSWR